VHCQADKKGDIVRIWTEEGREITKNCPTMVTELAKLSSEDFKVIGEMELWKEDKHQNRAVTAGVLNTKEVHPDEKFLVLNLFDCLYYKSQDIHTIPYSERLHHLKSFLFVKKELRVKLAETRIVKTESELRNALNYFSKLEGSEGAYLKKLDFPYSLSGRTTENVKFKNELSVEVQIVKVNVVGATTKK
jgi:ATP-dependent DNA ligase